MKYHNTYEERKNDSQMHFWVVKKIRLHQYLIEHGFQALKQQTDRNNPRFQVWIYPKSDELLAAIEDYYSTGYFAEK